jgi:hypothetical protein
LLADPAELCRLSLAELQQLKNGTEAVLLVDSTNGASVLDKLQSTSGLCSSTAECKATRQSFMVCQVSIERKLSDDRYQTLLDDFEDTQRYLANESATVDGGMKGHCSFRIKAHGKTITVPMKLFIGGIVQVWGAQTEKTLEDLAQLVSNSLDIENPNHRNQLLTFHLDELRGDHFQSLWILKIFYTKKNRAQARQIVHMSASIEQSTAKKRRIQMDSNEEFQRSVSLNFELDDIIEQRLNAVLSGFISFNQPLLTQDDVRKMYTQFKQELPLMHEKIFIDIDAGRHGKEDRRYRILFEYIRRQRQRSRMNFRFFALAMAFAIDAVGDGGLAAEILQWEKVIAADSTLEKQKKRLREKLDGVDLKKTKNILISWDNFEKRTAMKWLRSGKSVDSAFCTVRYAREVNEPEVGEFDQESRNPEELTYLDQKIPFPPGTFPFESLDELQAVDLKAYEKMVHLILCSDKSTEELKGELYKIKNSCIAAGLLSLSPDENEDDSDKSDDDEDHSRQHGTSGTRTDCYLRLLSLSNTMTQMHRFLSSTGQVEGTNQDLLNAIMKQRQSLETAKKFQERCVSSWNPFAENVTKLFPMEAS